MLFDRSSRPVRPTSRGLEALASARRVLDVLREFETLGRPRRRGSGLSLHLGLSHALVRLLGNPVIADWRASCPRMELRVRSGWSLDLLGHLRERTLDALLGPFTSTWQPPMGVSGTRLAGDRMVLVCPPGTRLPKVTALRNLLDQAWILNGEGCGVRRSVEQAAAEAGTVLVPAVEAIGDFGVLLDLVAAGLGVTLAPSRLVAQHPASAGLETHPIEGSPIMTTFWLCWREPSEPLRPVLQGLERALGRCFLDQSSAS